LEGGSKGKVRLEEGDRGGYGLTTGRSAIEEEKKREEKNSSYKRLDISLK
jgi:hypothetical protein